MAKRRTPPPAGRASSWGLESGAGTPSWNAQHEGNSSCRGATRTSHFSGTTKKTFRLYTEFTFLQAIKARCP